MKLRAQSVSLLVALLASAPSFGAVSVGLSVRVRTGPPPLPVSEQPPCPGPGYVWTPGYWAWDEQGGYYWVPGTWVVAPVGMLWTPGWWGWRRGFYVWHRGYWGPRVGFYGGIDYGHGYPGSGYWGGSWRGNVFYYNRAASNVGHVTTVYEQPVAVRRASPASYNGGPGGVVARATAQEQAASRAPHVAPLPIQAQHQQQAASRAPGAPFRGAPVHPHAHHMHGAPHHGGGHHRR